MIKILRLVFVLNCFTALGQNNDSIAQKRIEQEAKRMEQMQRVEKFKESKLSLEQFKDGMYEKAAKNLEAKNIDQLKKELLIEDSKAQPFETLTTKATGSFQQQQYKLEGIIGNEKETEVKMPEATEGLSEGTGENAAARVSISPSETEDDNNRLFGPSQYDSRIEPTQLSNAINWQQQILQNSNAVGMILERDKITQLGKDFYQIDDQQTLGKRYNLCPTEAFYSQPVVGVGTAWLYDSNKMVTASHVLESNIKNYIVIFGFQILNEYGLIDVFISKAAIYDIKKIIKKDIDLDLVAFELDRAAIGIPLAWENAPKSTGRATEIYMIGFPTGLPMKVALNANIEEATHPSYFYTSLDSFQGNSGSPVFNFYTNKVIGVLVSGEIDYAFNGNCYYSPVCKIPYCKGEKVIRIERFME